MNISDLMAALWRDIRESVRGSEQNFTEGGIGRAILLLSIPMVLEMVMESVFAIVDIFFVSRLGADAVATVGLTESMLTIVYAIAVGLSMATTAIVARRIGGKDQDGAAVATVQAILVGIAISVPVATLGLFFSSGLLRLMGASSRIIGTEFTYTAIMLGGNGIIMMLFIINAIYRGAGDAAIAMRVLWIANLINIVLDPCLIFGLGPFPRLGIAGAAVATTVGRGFGVMLQFFWLRQKRGRIQIERRHVAFNFSVTKKLIRLSLGGIGQYLISTSSWVVLMRIMAVFGSEALAGYTIAIRILVFSILPSWGMSNAAATLVGQNLGAKKPERAEKSVWLSGFINMLFLGGIAVIFIWIPDFFIRLFTHETEVVRIGSDCLRYLSFGYLFYAYGMVISQAFNGAGDTTTPTIMNFFCFWLLEIPLAYTLSLPFALKEKGVFLAIVISESVLGVTGILLFRRGKWKNRRV
ncbi:MAG TPA: MATE family efflux transporter [Bacteroidetes bacterium]|nr:MATE family efflux transporter [Bacteroidota bacterium]